MKYCDECGVELSDEMQFCDSCGAEQELPEETQTEDAPEPKEEPKPKKSTATDKKKGKGGLIAIILIVILLAGGAGAYYFLFMSDSAVYQKAISLYEAQSYDEAIATLENISDYSDSAEKIKEISFAKANALYNDGNLQEALETFKTISDYSNSSELISQIENKLKYDEAVTLLENGDAQGALALFEEITGYEDSDKKAVDISNAILLGVYDSAINGEWVVDTESTNALYAQGEGVTLDDFSLIFGANSTVKVKTSDIDTELTYEFGEDKITADNGGNLVSLSFLQSENDTMYIEYSYLENAKIIFKAKNNSSSYVSESSSVMAELSAEKAVEKFEEFMSSGAFREEVFIEYDEDQYAYVIYDIQQDGVPELLIVGNSQTEWRENFFFRYNTETDSLEQISSFSTYAGIRYSEKYKSIVFQTMKPFSGLWQYNFYTLNGEEGSQMFEDSFSISGDGGNGATLYEGENETHLSEIEISTYFNELTDFEFVEVEALPKEEIAQTETTNSPVIHTSYVFDDPNSDYDSSIILYTDGTFKFEIYMLSYMGYAFGTYSDIGDMIKCYVTDDIYLLTTGGNNLTYFEFEKADFALIYRGESLGVLANSLENYFHEQHFG